MKRLLILLALPMRANADVIKNDTFTVAGDTPLENHTSDSGGGWQGGDVDDADVIAATDSVAGDEAPVTIGPLGYEDPTEPITSRR